MKSVPAAIVGFVAMVCATISLAVTPGGTIHDPDRLLSPDAAAKIHKAAIDFRKLTGHGMVVIVSARSPVPHLGALAEPKQGSPSYTGIIYAISPADKAGRLLVMYKSLCQGLRGGYSVG